MGGNLVEIMVSVVVVTYNSARYVIETLESIKTQTYRNIELIVSDDGSTDNTLELIKQWLNINEDRFVKYKIVQSEINTGITPNLNRGIAVATGEYIKPIAGDDLLCSDCIKNLLEYTLENSLNFTYAKVIPFTDSDSEYQAKLTKYEKLNYEIFEQDVKKQYRTLLTGFPMPTNGLFFNKDFILSIGGFDASYRMMDDYPIAVKLTSLGHKLNLLNEYVVKYRMRPPSERAKFFSSKRKNFHSSDLSRFQNNELLPNLWKEKMFISIYNLFIERLASAIEEYNNGLICLYLSKAIGYLSFSKIALRIKMIGCKNNGSNFL